MRRWPRTPDGSRPPAKSLFRTLWTSSPLPHLCLDHRINSCAAAPVGHHSEDLVQPSSIAGNGSSICSSIPAVRSPLPGSYELDTQGVPNQLSGPIPSELEGLTNRLSSTSMATASLAARQSRSRGQRPGPTGVGILQHRCDAAILKEMPSLPIASRVQPPGTDGGQFLLAGIRLPE